MTGLDHGTLSGVFKNILESKTPYYVPSSQNYTTHQSLFFSNHNSNNKIDTFQTATTFSPPFEKESD